MQAAWLRMRVWARVCVCVHARVQIYIYIWSLYAARIWAHRAAWLRMRVWARECVCVCARACADMYARMCQHVGESMQYVYASSTWQGGAPIPFSSILLQLPMTTSYSLGASHRILERRDFPTHRDSAGRVHLRPLPPKWADGHWLQWEGHPTSHSYWMRLPKVSLLAWQVYLEGLTLASAVYIIKKRLARGCQVKLPACRPVRRGCFSAPVLFSTITQPFGWKAVSDAFQHRVFQHTEILKCSRMDSAWKVPDKTDTKKAPFNYNWILYYIGSYMDSCHVD